MAELLGIASEEKEPIKEKRRVIVTIDISKDFQSSINNNFFRLFDNAYGSNNEKKTFCCR